jgi:hypothetical protein
MTGGRLKPSNPLCLREALDLEFEPLSGASIPQ